MIKDMSKLDVKLPPLDLGQNDYVGEFIQRINAMKDELDEAMSSIQNPS